MLAAQTSMTIIYYERLKFKIASKKKLNRKKKKKNKAGLHMFIII